MDEALELAVTALSTDDQHGGTAVRPTYIRHKPGQSTVIAVEVTSGPSVAHGYVVRYEDPARARVAFAKAGTRRMQDTPLGAGVRMLGGSAVLRLMPNDARLGRLRWYTDTRKIKRSLASLTDAGDLISGKASNVTVLRYKPERRLVAHVAATTVSGARHDWLLRYTARPGAQQLANIAKRIADAGVTTPSTVATLEDDRVSIDQFLAGVQLFDLLVGAEQTPLSPPVDLAERLAHLHSIQSPTTPTARHAHADLNKTCGGLQVLSNWSHSFAEPGLRLARALGRRVPDDVYCPTLIHGDLHLKNVMATADGYAFVDLERAQPGRPETDLGTLVAQSISAAVRPGRSSALADFCAATVDAYSGRHALDQQSLRWWTSVALAEQALLTARHLEPEWEQTVAQLLELAIDHADAPAARVGR
ncbi:MAG: aminoglycoside phosphotransferase family protein [Acidimicrobiales bacterium]|nr:aminoglycoside phosphotransferase family protein [Acidimicrobiales bacterium]